MDAEDLILLFSFLECFNCWWVRCGGLGRKSYLGQAEIACFYLFRNAKVSIRFPCLTPGMERFSLDLWRTLFF